MGSGMHRQRATSIYKPVDTQKTGFCCCCFFVFLLYVCFFSKHGERKRERELSHFGDPSPGSLHMLAITFHIFAKNLLICKLYSPNFIGQEPTMKRAQFAIHSTSHYRCCSVFHTSNLGGNHW